MSVQKSISFLDSILLSFHAGWKEHLSGSDEPDLLYFDPRFVTLKGDRKKSPKLQLRALCKSCRKHPEDLQSPAHFAYHLLIKTGRGEWFKNTKYRMLGNFSEIIGHRFGPADRDLGEDQSHQWPK